MDIEMFGKISDAFGPSGFEEEVVRTVAGYCGKYQVENDAMNNLYVRMPGRAGDKPVVQLDAHLDECGFACMARSLALPLSTKRVNQVAALP